MYLLASKKTAFAELLYNRLKEKRSEELLFVNTKDELNAVLTAHGNEIEMIFFFHWNYIVREEIFGNYKCITFHTSNLPEGRGGSPIQNQIVKGEWKSRVNALEMAEEVDAGGVYDSVEISLQGNLNDIWLTITRAVERMIMRLMDCPEMVAIVQEEKLPITRRRKDNVIPFESSSEEGLEKIYDFIRMLDGNGYPRAYYEIGHYRLEFKRSHYEVDDERILADVIITRKKQA